MDKWQTLVEESKQLAHAAGFMPPVHRTFHQVAALAENLRKKVSGVDFNLKELATSRLLARGGLSTRPFVKTAKRPFGDAASPGEEGRGGAKKPFLTKIDQDGSAIVENTIRSLLHRIDEGNRVLGPVRPGVIGKEDGVVPEHLAHSWTYSGVVADTNGPRGATGLLGLKGLPLKEQAYVDVVTRMVEEIREASPFDAAGEFLDAATGVVGADEHMVACWGALKAMVASMGAGVDGRDAGSQAVTKSLLKGARMFLESRNDRGMKKLVHESRRVILIGGNPNKMREIQNYVVYRHHQLGKLDVRDGQEGFNTSWAQVYYALRSGNIEEALEAVKGAQWMCPNQVVKPFRTYLEEWAREDGELSAVSCRELMGVCRDILNRPNPERKSPFFKYKVLTLAFLCGNVDLADELSMAIPRLWENLDEYLWFHVGCTRMGHESPSYTLQNLQKRIQEFPSTHYSRSGKDPMLYTMVLIVTLQFKEAVAFMAQDSIAERNRSEAVHFALAFHHHGILEAGSSTISEARTKFGALVESFGHQFSRTNSFLTLDYYLLAVHLQHENPNLLMMAHALRKVLLQTGDHRRLLDTERGFSLEHPIRKFVQLEADQKQILLHAGNECEKFSENNEAYFVFMSAREYARALGIINVQIAQVLRKWAQDSQQGSDRIDKIDSELLMLAKKGEAASEKVQPEASGSPQRNGFNTLEVAAMIFRNFFNKRFSEAVNGAQKLRFIPFQSSEAEEKANCLKFVDKSLSYVLSDLLLIYVKALVSKYQENPMNPNPSDQLAGIAAFARLVPPPFVVAKEVFREIVAFG